MWCANCETAWHAGVTCEENNQARVQREAEEERAMLASGYKKCPSCGVMIEKDQNWCNSMVCVRCGQPFCWLCMSKFSSDADTHAHFALPGTACYEKCNEGIGGGEDR